MCWCIFSVFSISVNVISYAKNIPLYSWTANIWNMNMLYVRNQRQNKINLVLYNCLQNSIVSLWNDPPNIKY